MTRRILVVVPLVALGGAVLGVVLPWQAAVIVATLAGILVTVLTWTVEVARVRGMAEQVNTWLGKRQHDPVRPTGGAHWRHLAIAVNALGAAYDRRGEKLRRERPWRRDLVDSLVEPALLFRGDGRLDVANAAARSKFNLPDPAPAEATVVQALGSAALAGAVREVRETGRRVEVDAHLGEREVRAVASPVGDEILLVVADLTQQRHVEQVRRNFVVNASHELKTPATSIQTLADALEVAVVRSPERAGELVGRLREESERLVRLVHDLLDLRRLEDVEPLERVPFDLAALAREVAADLHDVAAARGVEVSVEAPDHAMLAGVPADLRLVVRNLLDNAIQYNVEGGRVDVTLTSRPGAHELTVSDTGIGIPRQDLGRIFERFYRVDVARSRERGGTGLGLSIVRHAVERHGGTVKVTSLLGEGTTFTVTLPVSSEG